MLVTVIRRLGICWMRRIDQPLCLLVLLHLPFITLRLKERGRLTPLRLFLAGLFMLFDFFFRVDAFQLSLYSIPNINASAL